MDVRVGTVVRVALLAVLFLLSAAFDPPPAWWWASFFVVMVWTLLDVTARHRGDEDD